jgi:hypothetical protein
VLSISKNQALVLVSALVVGGAVLAAALVMVMTMDRSPTGEANGRPAPALSPVESDAAAAVLGAAPSLASSPSARPSVAAPPEPAAATPSPKVKIVKASAPPAVTTPTSADGWCIQLPATVVDKAGVSAAPCDGSAGQRWTFTREGAFYHAGADKCLTIGGNQGRDINYRIQLFPCNYGPPQIYVPQPDGTLYNASAKRCFGIYPASEGGPALGILPCNNGANERWKLPS